MKRAMLWVLYDYMKNAVDECNENEYFSRFDELINLDLPADEDMVLKSVCWTAYKLMSKLKEQSKISSDRLDVIVNHLICIPFIHDQSTSALLRLFSDFAEEYEHFDRFVAWWNLDNLDGEDFNCGESSDGKQLPSLAEKVCNNYSKWLMKYGSEEQIINFLPTVNRFVEKYNNKFTVYFLAKLYVKLGDSDNAVKVFKPFAKQNRTAFWVWELFAEMKNTPDEKLPFLCKALTCKTKEDMLVSVRIEAAKVFAGMRMYDAARTEWELAYKTRIANSWKIPAEMNSISKCEWFVQSNVKKNNNSIYETYAMEAENVLYDNLHSEIVLVSGVNREKNFISFVTKERKQGFAKLHSVESVENNTLLSLTIDNIASEDPTNVIDWKHYDDIDDAFFYKDVTGILRIMDSGCGFVENVYVDKNLLSQFNNGDNVVCHACISFDKKKSKWGWRAVTIKLE